MVSIVKSTQPFKMNGCGPEMALLEPRNHVLKSDIVIGIKKWHWVVLIWLAENIPSTKICVFIVQWCFFFFSLKRKKDASTGVAKGMLLTLHLYCPLWPTSQHHLKELKFWYLQHKREGRRNIKGGRTKGATLPPYNWRQCYLHTCTVTGYITG